MGEIKFWTCLVEEASGSYAVKYRTLEEARQEAERLARLPSNRNRKVWVFELVCFCEVPGTPVQWTEVERRIR